MTTTAEPGTGTPRERDEVSLRADAFVEDLSEWLRIPSISADPGRHGDVARSALWLAERLRAEGWPQVEIWDDPGAAGGVRGVARRGPAPRRPSWCTATTTSSRPTSRRCGHRAVRADDRRRGAARPRRLGRQGPAAFLPARPRRPPRRHRAGRAAPCTSSSWSRARRSPARRTSPRCSPRAARRWPATRSSSPTPAWSARDAPTICTGMRGLVDAEVVVPRPRRSTCTRARSAARCPTRCTALARLVAALHDDEGRVSPRLLRRRASRSPTSSARRARRCPSTRPEWLAGRGGRAGRDGEDGLQRPRAALGPARPPRSTACGAATPAPATRRSCRATRTPSCPSGWSPTRTPRRSPHAVRAFVAEHTPAGITAEVHHRRAPASRRCICADRLGARRAGDPGGDGPGVRRRRSSRPARAAAGPEAAARRPARPRRWSSSASVLPTDRIHAPDERGPARCCSRAPRRPRHLWRLLGERGV